MSSPNLGEEIVLARDALVEIVSPGSTPIWRYLAAGSRGRLIGWRARTTSSAVVDVSSDDQHVVVFVREELVARA